MPWELRLVSADDRQPLGSIEQVQARLCAAVPGVDFYQDASGPEKIAAMEAQGIEVPEVIRAHWLQSRGEYRGLIQGDGFTIELYLGDDGTAVATVGVDVRGDGDTMPIVQRLMAIEGWRLLDLAGDPPSVEVE